MCRYLYIVKNLLSVARWGVLNLTCTRSVHCSISPLGLWSVYDLNSNSVSPLHFHPRSQSLCVYLISCVYVCVDRRVRVSACMCACVCREKLTFSVVRKEWKKSSKVITCQICNFFGDGKWDTWLFDFKCVCMRVCYFGAGTYHSFDHFDHLVFMMKNKNLDIISKKRQLKDNTSPLSHEIKVVIGSRFSKAFIDCINSYGNKRPSHKQ